MLFKKEENQRVHSEVLLDFDTFCDDISYKHVILPSMKSFHEGENRKKYFIFSFMILFSRISLCLYELKRLLIKYLFKISTEGGQSISRDYKFPTKMVIKSAA